MTPCPVCGTHRRPSSSCPHCGGLPSVARTSIAAAMLGLALVGCAGDKDATTGDTDHTDDTDTTPTTGVDYGMMMVAPLEDELPPAPEDPEIPEDEDLEPR